MLAQNVLPIICPLQIKAATRTMVLNVMNSRMAAGCRAQTWPVCVVWTGNVTRLTELGTSGTPVGHKHTQTCRTWTSSIVGGLCLCQR